MATSRVVSCLGSSGDVRGELAVAPYVLIDQAAALYSS
jgi:hypothetical protein